MKSGGKHGGRMGVNDDDTDEFEIEENIMFEELKAKNKL
jgi:hypothetical protein